MASPQALQDPWESAILKAIGSVVSIHFSCLHPFETSSAGCSQATGWVVDAVNGYVITNRHVVGAGPFSGRIKFHNKEEAPVKAIYRDPIHDFGFLKYDPEKASRAGAVSLDLRPDLAAVTVEIKVIGNDGGEVLSILSGTISRVDRNPPAYGGYYRDFNTRYYQASAAATGGSSGSPVINRDGHAIALVAGGRVDKATTDYFLPLDAPRRALQLIREGKPVTRGDIQCSFVLQPFETCRQLGLASNLEADVRQASPTDNNMLVVVAVIPEGVSDKKLKEGDIVLKVNGQWTTRPQQLEDQLNESIGQTLRFSLCRAGAEIEEEILVQDLEHITPRAFVAVAGAGLHDLPPLLSYRYRVAREGVFLARAGNLLPEVAKGAYKIETVDHKDTPCLSSFIDVMREIRDRTRVVIQYQELWAGTSHTTTTTVNRHWLSRMKRITRNDTTGDWDFEVLAEALPRISLMPSEASFACSGLEPVVAAVARSFVAVSCFPLFAMEGDERGRKRSMGLVLDAERGLVFVSRKTVPHHFVDVEVTVADSITVDGSVLFLHPTQNYSIVKYDPSLVNAPVQTASLLGDPIAPGASMIFVGHGKNDHMVYTNTRVTTITLATLPPFTTPRYRPVNTEWIDVDTSLASECDSGVLMTPEGKVQAMWMSCGNQKSRHAFGLEMRPVLDVLSRLREGDPLVVRIPPAEFASITMSEARVMGVTAGWIKEVHEKDSRHCLLKVLRTFAQAQSVSSQLKEGDVLLTLNGRLVTRAADLDDLYHSETGDAVVVRGGQELNVQVATLPGDVDTKHVICLAGMLLTAPHLAVRQQMKEVPAGVYISEQIPTSVITAGELGMTEFITHINGKPTPSLGAILEEILKIPDDTHFRVRGVSFELKPFVTSAKKNDRWHPTIEWFLHPSAPDGWRRKTYEGDHAIEGEGLYGVI